tara:strand:- start:3758 stop:4135 length:378 start_codon:yes stop_codon:yes gene_type:complete
METKKDLNEIAQIESSIKKKYGEEAIQNPKSSWTQDKEKKFLADLKEFYKDKKTSKKTSKEEGFRINFSEKLLKKQERTCPVCQAYSFSSRDDLYMNKFKCCFKCYIQYIEGREERWKSGWRPNN